jgi:hypothetical protein
VQLLTYNFNFEGGTHHETRQNIGSTGRGASETARSEKGFHHRHKAVGLQDK